jgi:hypothetical protein
MKPLTMSEGRDQLLRLYAEPGGRPDWKDLSDALKEIDALRKEVQRLRDLAAELIGPEDLRHDH